MGTVSGYAKREDAIMSNNVIEDRSGYLKDKLTLKEPDQPPLTPSNHNPMPKVSKKLMKKLYPEQGEDFTPLDMVQTKNDETVFSRLNPHLPQVKQ